MVPEEKVCDGSAKLAEDLAMQTTSASADGMMPVYKEWFGFWGGFCFLSCSLGVRGGNKTFFRLA